MTGKLMLVTPPNIHWVTDRDQTLVVDDN